MISLTLKKILCLSILITCNLISFGHQYTPDITIVFVIDQFPYSFTKYLHNLKGGIRYLWSNGIVFHNATYPHAMPTTPTGHAAIATGCYACMHGFNSYGFVNKENKFVEITEDNSENAMVLTDEQNHVTTGRSPKYLTTETVADQFVLSSRNSSKPKYHEAVSFSLKPRASIPLAGNLGIALWMEKNIITTSKFYEKVHPEWLKKFNQKNKLKNGKKFTWCFRYNPRSSAYNYPEINNYEYSYLKPAKHKNKSIVRQITIDSTNQESYNDFYRSPFASQFLFAAAKAYIKNKRNKKLLVYISLSNFDLSGHVMGADNIEQVDLLYHIDHQIGKMIDFINSYYGSKKSLFILTSDHGASSIPEILQKHGMMSAVRINGKELIDEINKTIEKEFGYHNIVQHYEAPQIFLDQNVLEKISEIKKNQLYQKIKDIFFSKDYIVDVWSDLDFEKNSSNVTRNKEFYELFLKQYVKGRSGNIVYLPYPNKMITPFPTGTSHHTPYRLDVHVPLIIYQRLRFEKQQVYEPVSMLSLANTQAFLMGIQPPSTATTEYLPGIKLIINQN